MFYLRHRGAVAEVEAVLVAFVAALALTAAQLEPSLRADFPPAEGRAFEDGSLLIGLGERLVVRFDAELKPTVTSLEPIGPDGPSADHATQDAAVVVFTLHDLGEKGAMLTVDSALTHRFDYGARMLIPTGDGRYAGPPTTTCTVAAGSRTYELWADRFDAIVLGPFLRADADQLVCRDNTDRAPRL